MYRTNARLRTFDDIVACGSHQGDQGCLDQPVNEALVTRIGLMSHSNGYYKLNMSIVAFCHERPNRVDLLLYSFKRSRMKAEIF